VFPSKPGSLPGSGDRDSKTVTDERDFHGDILSRRLARTGP
jgi:hypothetical protein